jgi:hypothetical protein
LTDPEITADNAGIPDPELPTPAILLALSEFLADAAEGQKLPPGLNIRVVGDFIEVLSRGRVIATIDRAALLERAGLIAGERN